MLELKNLSVAKRGCHLLGPIDLALQQGEVLAVIGANGAGKSTLLSVLSGLEKGFSGLLLHTELGGFNEIDPRVLARQRALMPQFHSLGFDFTVREVVALGRNPHVGECPAALHREMIELAMHEAKVFDLQAMAYTRLSGGQQARVQFARVLAQLGCGQGESRLLLLDEPTASLDLRCQLDLMDCVKRLAKKGLSCVAVLHDINLAARYADRILILSRGKILALGAPQEVLTEHILQTAFGLPVRVLDQALPDRRLVAV